MLRPYKKHNPWLRLVAFEIVDGGAHRFSGFFAWANGVDIVSNHLQRLERHHDFVIFHVVADQHENGFLGHDSLREQEE